MTGESRHLIAFLVKERQIPCFMVGRAKVLDEVGLKVLLEAIEDHKAKPEPESAASA